MAAPNDTVATRIRVSTTSSGTYTNVGYTRSFELNRGSENQANLRWFGGDAVRPGDLTLSGTIPVYWDDGDTTGQTVLESAYLAGSVVWLQFCPKGTATGAKAYQFSAIITEAAVTSDIESNAVEGSFSYVGTPSTLTTVTLA